MEEITPHSPRSRRRRGSWPRRYRAFAWTGSSAFGRTAGNTCDFSRCGCALLDTLQLDWRIRRLPLELAKAVGDRADSRAVAFVFHRVGRRKTRAGTAGIANGRHSLVEPARCRCFGCALRHPGGALRCQPWFALQAPKAIGTLPDKVDESGVVHGIEVRKPGSGCLRGAGIGHGVPPWRIRNLRRRLIAGIEISQLFRGER